MLPQRHPRALRTTARLFSVGAVNPKTLVDRLCESGQCGPDKGLRRLFRRSLHVHVRPLTPLILLLWPGHFELDREVIARVARARSMREVDDELRTYSDDVRNREWWRRHGRVRVSARRLRREARRIFREGGR
jgi:hypothetical protein